MLGLALTYLLHRRPKSSATNFVLGFFKPDKEICGFQQVPMGKVTCLLCSLWKNLNVAKDAIVFTGAARGYSRETVPLSC